MSGIPYVLLESVEKRYPLAVGKRFFQAMKVPCCSVGIVSDLADKRFFQGTDRLHNLQTAGAPRH